MAVYAVANAVFIKKLKWYFLCDIVFIILNSGGFYIATTRFLVNVAKNPLLLGTQKDAALAVGGCTFIVMLVCTLVKTHMASYEHMYGNKR